VLLKEKEGGGQAWGNEREKEGGEFFHKDLVPFGARGRKGR